MSALSQTLFVVSFGLAVGIVVAATAWTLVKELALSGRNGTADKPASMPYQAIIAVALILGGAAGLAMLSRVAGFATPTAQAWETALLAYGLAQLWYLAALFARIVEGPRSRALIARLRDTLCVLLSLAVVVATAASLSAVMRHGSVSLLGASAVASCLLAVLVMVNHWRDAAARSVH